MAEQAKDDVDMKPAEEAVGDKTEKENGDKEEAKAKKPRAKKEAKPKKEAKKPERSSTREKKKVVYVALELYS